MQLICKEREGSAFGNRSVRLGPHSKGDDTDKNLINKLKILILIKIESNIKEKDKINQICERIIEECFEIANNFETANENSRKLNNTLHELMNENNDLFIIGEDILDPYGGAFKVTKVCHKISKELLLPLYEGSIVGFSTGLAMSK